MVEFIDAIHSKFVPIPTNYTQAKPSFSNVDNEDFNAIFWIYQPGTSAKKRYSLHQKNFFLYTANNPGPNLFTVYKATAYEDDRMV
jgi:hypothetical protein